jgi:hypothetical protein
MKKVLQPFLMTCLGMATVCFLGTWVIMLLDRTSSRGPQCASPRASFSENDLIGTWIAGTPDPRDTLIIKANGTYKQIIHTEFSELPPTNYESPWQTWWLEDQNITVPVLHLEGYRLCGYNADISCDTIGGSGQHMCQVGYKDLSNEGVLYVMGGSEITLTLPLGLEDSWFYWQEK